MSPARFASLLFLATALAACGGIAEEPGTTSPAPKASAAPVTPTPTPTPIDPSSVDDGVSCWSPGGTTPTNPGGDDTICLLDGTWDYTASAGATGSLSFDSYGNWIGGAANADLCAAETMSGTYTLGPSEFTFVTINDQSVCGGNWGMTFAAAFDSSCTTAYFTKQTDGCTGARTEFNDNLRLKKR